MVGVDLTNSTVVLMFTWFQVTESSSLSVYELSVECSSNTTTYLSVTLRDIIQNKALISSNSLCQDGNSVKKLSAPTVVTKNESLFNVELTGLFIFFILFTKRSKHVVTSIRQTITSIRRCLMNWTLLLL